MKEAARAFSPWQRRMLPRFGIAQALHLRRAD
jgi:hypothetical protein